MNGPASETAKSGEIMQESSITLTETRKAHVSGPVNIGGVELDCYILEDGTAVLSKGKMMKALGRPWRGGSRSSSPIFVGAKNLQQFITPELEKKLEGVEFYDGKTLRTGYEADTLALVCDVYLAARQAKALTTKQQGTAQVCEILVRTFARVGIVALIYEQLRYEKFKNPDALRILVESYLAEELRKWSKEFPDNYYIQLDKIFGHEKTTSRNRPLYYAKFTRKYIYEPIQSGLVLAKLDEVNPINKEKRTRKHRHHSNMSENIGLPALRAQIWQVTALLSAAINKNQFERLWRRFLGQQEMDFNEGNE